MKKFLQSLIERKRKELKYKELNRRVTVQEYNELIDYAYDLGVRNCFTQEEESQSDSGSESESENNKDSDQ